jgi:hypothetical protein
MKPTYPHKDYSKEVYISGSYMTGALTSGTTDIPDNPKNINYRLYILDPLSVIVKLAILRNKPIGTKLRITDNVFYIQEPGPFQALCRLYFNSGKTDLQYLYNPIQLACSAFLNTRFCDRTPGIRKLFQCAISGLERLKETYKACPVIVLCLNYYVNLIENYLEEYMNEKLFKKDAMTAVYDSATITALNGIWTGDRIKVVMDIIDFLCTDNLAANNVQSLEIFINNIDLIVPEIINP